MTRQSLSRTRRVVSLSALGLAAGLGVAGCGVSKDVYTVQSTWHEPQSVAVIDTRTGDALWAYDVLIGQQVEINLQHSDGDDGFQGSSKAAESMDYEISVIDGATVDSGSIEFPEGADPRVDFNIRPAGNNPGETDLTGG
ncbi:MAG: hypothetical protein AAF288_08030 [Planctomycetota bacterium]